MKLKEVCTETGLSRKTIRLYEEKGLLVPQKEYRNGREYREYSQEDVTRLKRIALLRKAMFTMEEIHRMLEDPEAIQEIFPQYRQWLRQQKQTLEELISAAEQVKIQEVENIEELAACMEAAEQLPLPQWDCQPHFRYLDEIEEVRTMKKQQDYFEGRASDTKAFRQTTLVMDRDRGNDQAITFGQIKELESTPARDDGPVTRAAQEPRWMRVLSAIGGWVLAVGVVLYAIQELGYYLGLMDFRSETPAIVWVSIAMMILGGILYAVVRAIAAYRERQRWLNVVRAQEQEKQRKQN
jgi:DNA-binding transcriptional MerR regulator